jgi:hypothetical protein
VVNNIKFIFSFLSLNKMYNVTDGAFDIAVREYVKDFRKRIKEKHKLQKSLRYLRKIIGGGEKSRLRRLREKRERHSEEREIRRSQRPH